MHAFLRRLLATLATVFAAVSWAAPVLQVDANGTLTGASGVDVNGTLYNVQFVDGSCVSLFSGCDAASDFAFTTSAMASAAASALLNSVLINTAQGQFDAVPSLTNGCDATAFCYIYIPFFDGPLVNIPIREVLNLSANSVDLSDELFFTKTTNTGPPLVGFTYAVFTPAALSVPEPGTLALAAGALLATGLARRRRA